MKPYTHHVHKVTDELPGEFITTITGKKKFHEWALEHILKTGERICFRLEGWPYWNYLEVIPWPKMRGKNIGELRLVYVDIGEEPTT